jgi:putative ABC transport system permease protein
MTDPFDPVRPAIYLFNPDRVGDIALRLKHNTDVHSAIASIQSIVEKYNPAYPFEYKFVEDEFENKFVFEAQVGRLAGVFACLAIFISCLGLFGLVAFMAEQRVKEIGVRKILGASVIHLWNLMSASFIYLVLLSFAIATPLAFMFLESWLEKYSYRTSLSWWVFGVAGIGALLVTLITVSFQAIKAAMANPVRSLRSE